MTRSEPRQTATGQRQNIKRKEREVHLQQQQKKSDYSNRGSDYKKQAEAAVEDGWTDLAEIKGTQTMRGTERKKETEVSS